MASSTATTSPPRTFPKITTSGEKYTLYNTELLGRGAYSEVYKGRTASGRLVAVKTACKKVEIKAIIGEIDILQKLKGAQNIVQFIGSQHHEMPPGSVTRETISFAMEYAKSSLEAEMKRPENLKGLPENVLIDLVVDCSFALSALHEHKIAHRDIKHMNILLFPGTPTHGRRSNHLFKLCDMGCSKELLESKNEMRTLVGTPNLLHPFLAKEMVDPAMAQNRHNWKTKSAYTPEQCDLWSLGCTLYFCATGRLPFDHNDRSNKVVYNEAVGILTHNKKAIAMQIRNSNQGGYEYEPITELPAKFTRYPKWLVCTMTCLLRSFFHNPSIEYYSTIAMAMRERKRRTFVSVDQMCIVEHTDMSKIDDLNLPSISGCLGYPDKTNILFLSNTCTHYMDSETKGVDALPDGIYLVVPQRKEVTLRKIMPRNVEYREKEDMHDKRLIEMRMKKCYDGLSMLTETNEYVELFDRVATILSTQFSLLVKELSQFERVQTTSRFAVYVDMASVPMMLLDEANLHTKTISERCIQQAKQAREELERHAKVAMNIEGMAKRLALDSEELRLADLDFPGIREEIESYFFYDKATILATERYSQNLVEQCLKRRNHIMTQIFLSPDKIRKAKIKKAMDLAASLTTLKSDYQRLQNTISECVDLLERPFQEMKEVVNRCLQEQGCSRNSMQKSLHFLAPEFREDQQRVKKTTKSCQKLITKLNQEIEQLGFVRMGDTLVRTLTPGRQGSEESVEAEEERTLKNDVQVENEPESQMHILRPSLQACTTEMTLDPEAASFNDSTPPSSPKEGSNYFQAVFQYFAKNQKPSSSSSPTP